MRSALLLLSLLAADQKLAVVDAFFEAPDGAVVRNLTLNAGDTNYFSFRVAGFKPDAKQHVSLTYRIEMLDPKGAPVVEPLADKVESTLAPQDENWRPKVPWQAVIPPYAPSGDYLLKVYVEDKNAKTEARFEAAFKVRGETLEPEEKLVLHRFVFADTENGAGKPDNVYHPGSMLWARFKITGFQVTKEKEYWVEHDLQVLDSSGKVLFSNPNASVEQHKDFYPPRVLTTTFNLDLQKGIKPGEYTIRLDVRDRLGEQTLSHEEKFRVEQ
jgi:hypothetical protein